MKTPYDFADLLCILFAVGLIGAGISLVIYGLFCELLFG